MSARNPASLPEHVTSKVSSSPSEGRKEHRLRALSLPIGNDRPIQSWTRPAPFPVRITSWTASATRNEGDACYISARGATGSAASGKHRDSPPECLHDLLIEGLSAAVRIFDNQDTPDASRELPHRTTHGRRPPALPEDPWSITLLVGRVAMHEETAKGPVSMDTPSANKPGSITTLTENALSIVLPSNRRLFNTTRVRSPVSRTKVRNPEGFCVAHPKARFRRESETATNHRPGPPPPCTTGRPTMRPT